MRLRTTALALLLVIGTAATARAADATGTWKWSREVNGNQVESTLKLKQEGEKLTGTIKRGDNENNIEDGKVVGDMVTFKVNVEFNGNKFVINYQGKLSEDTIKGNVKFERDGETRDIPWEAKREK